VRKDQSETSILFELIAERYEHRSLISTCDRPFADWSSIFADQIMTVAAIDRLVHHAVILEFGSESYRKRAATARATRLTPVVVPQVMPTLRAPTPKTASVRARSST
jgi:DNA replication protein DnaC